ncbi:MAG: 2-oxo acid dehydrogenase subunit E2 [Anaerolineaceae bacterium]|nr:2-oxo acid dehydrogenase subunit E2 [Anaerolineaceae bacterium]
MTEFALPSSSTKPFDIQRQMVAHMTSLSWQNVPHISYLYEPDVTDFSNEFKKLAAEYASAGTRLSINTILVKVIIEGLKADPTLNAWIDYDLPRARGKIMLSEAINVSIPWKLTDGRMITPTLNHTENLSLHELNQAVLELGERIERTNIDELIHQAVVTNTVNELKKGNLEVFRRIFANLRRLNQHLKGLAKQTYYAIPAKDRLVGDDLTSGTVTISNIGSLYKEQRGNFALLEIVPPQIFAVGLGAMQEKPGVFTNVKGEKEIGIRNTLPMCMAFDHRAIDFDAMIPFLRKLDDIFEHPEIIHTW